VAALLVTCVLAIGPLPFPLHLPATPEPPAVGRLAGRFPRFGRVAVLIFENREYRRVIANPHAPYITRLSRRYALDTRYYAVGHPSLPNYLALTGGSTFGIRHDCNSCDVGAPSLMSQLDGAAISWKAYFESLPSAGYLGTRLGSYSKHLNPFVYYEGLSGNAADRSRIVPLRVLGEDLRRHSLPRLSWIAPNLCHDSHYCSVRTSDRYASRLVPAVLRALGRHGVLFVTWDEGTTRAGAHGSGGGHIALIAAGAEARRRTVSHRIANHYSLLRTLEAGLSLPALERAGSPTTPLLSSLLKLHRPVDRALALSAAGAGSSPSGPAARAPAGRSRRRG
jgi:hypothetical protein